MREALRLARRGRTHPNPRVGAVVVRGRSIIGRGYHRAAGEPHAESMALAAAAGNLRGATLYVTLEPCDHQGRTPPCSRAILATGISRVVVAARDPDPVVRGRGIRRLRRAGVEVTMAVLETEARALNGPYEHFHAHGRPWVEVKLAATLDGRIALQGGLSRWITGEAARRAGHRLRAAADCVLVGAETVRRDDPQLTARLSPGPNPLRAVLSGSLELPDDAALFRDGAAPTVVLTGTGAARSARARALREQGTGVLAVRRRRSRLDLEDALRQLHASHGTLRVLVEGGGDLATQLLAGGLADRLHLFLAPAIMGGEHRGWAGALGVRDLDHMPRLHEVRVRRLGSDTWIQGDLSPPES